MPRSAIACYAIPYDVKKDRAKHTEFVSIDPALRLTWTSPDFPVLSFNIRSFGWVGILPLVDAA
jgi:hypothetical protein